MPIILVLTACKQVIENPELADPIFADLNFEMMAAKALVETEQKNLIEIREKIRVLPPRDPSRGQLKKELAATEKSLMRARQNQIYFEIRKDQRFEWDQKAYKKSFDADKDWPDMQEFAEYKKMKALRAASPVWDTRVPKLTRHLKKPPEEPKAAPAGEGHGGGHEGGGEHH
jgi:hypothetical protein